MTLWFYKTEISVGIEPFVRQKTKVRVRLHVTKMKSHPGMKLVPG